MKIKGLELYAGYRSVGREAQKRGHEVFSIDITDYEGVSLVKDILEVVREDIPFVPDYIIGGPPCTSYSVAAISYHRRGVEPVSEFAKVSDELVKKTLEIFSWFPDAIWLMENPRGMLRKMPFMMNIPRTTITYCSYGDRRMKPTDIWSNNLRSLFNPDGWQGRPMCFNENPNCHHDSAPRGSTLKKMREAGLDISELRKNGTQGMKNAHERSKYPPELCNEWLDSIEKSINLKYEKCI